jgi:hypothetical protein
MTYGIPYTVRGWPDEIVTTVAVDDFRELIGGYTHVIRGSGPVILVPTVALTPVDTTPEEPEPGAWDLNGVLCVRFAGDDTERPWAVAKVGVTGGFVWLDWHMAWEKLGGPGITPRRLVPEPAPVELPFTTSVGEIEVTAVGQLRVFNSICKMTKAQLEQTGQALISAARAAREATP